ncbi:hypothetical protein HPB51_028444 [Rhipicephalus microplus]|uniref:Uncharacterized protein n=1 Tax=Rhipicephalus microplus TaxID=6941 RepID=A0A9J6CXS4_RHIMP|nr:hypothetical protein HPB51_028444 [Rhipicephalus microplus]
MALVSQLVAGECRLPATAQLTQVIRSSDRCRGGGRPLSSRGCSSNNSTRSSSLPKHASRTNLGSSSEALREMVRSIAKEELQKLLTPQVTMPVSSLTTLIRDKVRQAILQAEPEAQPVRLEQQLQERPVPTYADAVCQPALHTTSFAAPRGYRPGSRCSGYPAKSRPWKSDVWRTPDRTPLCFHGGETGHLYRMCPYRREPNLSAMDHVAKQWPYSVSSSVGLIDTHCHLDFLFRKTRHHGTFSEFRRKHQATFPLNYEGCVAVFCDPDTFKKRSVWQGLLAEKGVWGAFGCQPHMAKLYDEDIEDAMIDALEQPKVVALGEIAARLPPPATVGKQGKLPLVIHSRDASQDTLRILKEVMPADWHIHRHCFTGGWSEAQQWMDTFPNLFLGLTPLVGFHSAGPLAEVGRRIPLDRLLLETDAPYFLPKSESNRLKQSHSRMPSTWPRSCRHARHPAEEVLVAVRQNTRRMYRI